MERTEQEIYRSEKITNPSGSDNLSHLTHFILAHANKLNKLRLENNDDYYEDTDYIIALYNKGVRAWSEQFSKGKIGLADLVESDWFWSECIKKELGKMQKDKITINGIELNDKQVLMVKEAMNGHNEFGAQYEGYLESAEGLSIDEQSSIISSIYNMF